MNKYIDENKFLIGDVHFYGTNRVNDTLFGVSFDDTLTAKITRKTGDILIKGIAVKDNTVYRIDTTVNIFNDSLLDTRECIESFVCDLKENGYCDISMCHAEYVQSKRPIELEYAYECAGIDWQEISKRSEKEVSPITIKEFVRFWTTQRINQTKGIRP